MAPTLSREVTTRTKRRLEMISAWKRFISKADISPEASSSSGNHGVPPGIQKLDKDLQRKFARGVNYNMKIVIKGDAKVGKTALFMRLKGYDFDEQYSPTINLSVTSINWSYKTTDDIVKIDLWEAIDSTSKRNVNYVDLKLNSHLDSTGIDSNSHSISGRVLPNDSSTSPQLNLDQINNNRDISKNMNSTEHSCQSYMDMNDQIDVFKGANAVLFVMDMTKLWTFKYIQSELPKAPKNLPVLIIANHRDQGHHRTVSPGQVKSYIETLDRSPCDGIVMYTEASMKNGFGLKVIQRFFNIPFLKSQESVLLKQLELNRCEFMSTFEELQLMEESIDREYEQYLELETLRRRQVADAQSPVNLGIRNLDETTRAQIRQATVSSCSVDKMNGAKNIESNNSSSISEAQVMADQNFRNDRLPSIVMGAKCPLPEPKAMIMRKSHDADSGGVDTSNDGNISDDSDDEEPRANPLVANYQSDIDSDDQMNEKSN